METLLFLRRGTVEQITGTAKLYRRSGDSGNRVDFHFCPECGSTVYWAPERMPDVLGIAVGGFADPRFPAPEQAVFSRSRHTWLDLSKSVREVA